MKTEHLLNEQIRSPKIMLFDKDGEKIGEMPRSEAIKRAEDAELDLMQVGESPDFAVCKLVNYESWLYHENKKKHKQEMKNRSHEMKGIKLTPKIAEHDFERQIGKILEFVQEGHKVKVSIRLKGREASMRSVNDAFVEKIREAISDFAAFEGAVNYAGREINFLLTGAKKPTVKAKP